MTGDLHERNRRRPSGTCHGERAPHRSAADLRHRAADRIPGCRLRTRSRILCSTRFWRRARIQAYEARKGNHAPVSADVRRYDGYWLLSFSWDTARSTCTIPETRRCGRRCIDFKDAKPRGFRQDHERCRACRRAAMGDQVRIARLPVNGPDAWRRAPDFARHGRVQHRGAGGLEAARAARNAGVWEMVDRRSGVSVERDVAPSFDFKTRRAWMRRLQPASRSRHVASSRPRLGCGL
jgi:hypothetical protein